jgi:hypothetical protein
MLSLAAAAFQVILQREILVVQVVVDEQAVT